jgi:ABC-type polysaccharide/polyol phosphate export permease
MTVYADLLRYRELFANLFRRDFQAKYKGSLLGVLWSLLNPLVLLGVYLVVFGLIFPNKSISHYPVYLLAGLACWIFFSVSLQSASRSMVDSAELIRKVRFPRQLVAFSMVATQAVTFGVMLVILIVLSLVFIPDGRTTVWVAIPLAVVFAGLVAGLSLIVACLNVLFRDIEHVLTAALLPWFFLTPILWNAASPPDKAKSHPMLIEVLRWGNPIAPPIAAVRDAISWLPPRSRSCSARSSSCGSTTGLRSNFEDDPAVVDPGLAARSGERGQSCDVVEPVELDAGEHRRAEERRAEAGDPAGARRVAGEHVGPAPPLPGDRTGNNGEAFGVRGTHAFLPVGRRLDAGGQVGPRLAGALADQHVLHEHRAAELREPGAVLGDHVEGEPVGAGRDRSPHRRLDGATLARLEPGRGGPPAVPDDRIVAIVEPVIGEADAGAPRDRAGVLQLDLNPCDGPGVRHDRRGSAPAHGEWPFRHGG